MTQSPTLLPELLREALQQGQKAKLIVSSNSMAPLIRQGDEVTLVALEPANLQVGDIIAFADSSGMVAHRYWGYKESDGNRKILTKGDRLSSYDPLNDADTIVGQVVLVSNKQKHLYLCQWPGRWLNRQVTRLALWEIKFAGPFLPSTLGIKSPVPQGPKSRNDSFMIIRKTAAYLTYRFAHLLTNLLLLLNAGNSS